MKFSAGLFFWPAEGEVVTGTMVTMVVAKHDELFSSSCALLIVYLLGLKKLIEIYAAVSLEVFHQTEPDEMVQ